MNLPEPLESLPDSTPCYVPGVGEVTLGMVRATEEKPALEAEEEATLLMWRFIASHPDARPWPGSGDTSPESKAFRAYVYTNATKTLRSRLNGTPRGNGTSAA